MIWIRSVAFVLLSFATTLVFLLSYPLILAPAWVGWRIFSAFIRVETFWLRWICGIRVEISGTENLPGGPCLLASRHESMWETLYLPWFLGSPAVILKKEILGYPIAGPIARKLGYIGVDRTGDLEAAKKSFQQARAVAAGGRNILIFPSGTRDPEYRDRVQSGVAVLYRQVRLPCVPIVLNSGDHWLYKSWLRRPGTIRIRILPAIPADLPTREFVTRLEHDLSRPAHSA